MIKKEIMIKITATIFILAVFLVPTQAQSQQPSPPFDFEVKIVQEVKEIRSEVPAEVTVDVILIEGTPQDVRLSCNVKEERYGGIRCMLDPDTIMPGEPATLIIDARGGFVPGDEHHVIVTGASGDKTHSDQIVLTVVEPEAGILENIGKEVIAGIIAAVTATIVAVIVGVLKRRGGKKE